MALNPADMTQCNIKNTCLGGVNDGTAYDPGDPCPSGWTFDDTACDCESPCYNNVSGVLTIQRNLTTWSWTNCGSSSCTQNCNSDYWRPCVTNTGTTTHNLTNVRCIVMKSDAVTGPHCGLTPPCDYGRFIYFYICDTPNPASCGIIPFTYIDAGSQCGSCMSGSVTWSFNPEISTRVRMVLTGGGPFDGYNVGDVLLTQNAPSTVGGNKTTYKMSITSASASWDTDCDALFDCLWGSSLTTTKTGTCSGGSASMFSASIITYVNGAYQSFTSLPITVTGVSQCGSPVGTTASISVRYERELSPGQWESFEP